MSNLKPICGLWKRESKNGKKYLSGKIDGHWVQVYQVIDKKNPKQPDFQVYFSDTVPDWYKEPEKPAAKTEKPDQSFDLTAKDDNSEIPF